MMLIAENVVHINYPFIFHLQGHSGISLINVSELGYICKLYMLLKFTVTFSVLIMQYVAFIVSLEGHCNNSVTND